MVGEQRRNVPSSRTHVSATHKNRVGPKNSLAPLGLSARIRHVLYPSARSYAIAAGYQANERAHRAQCVGPPNERSQKRERRERHSRFHT